MSELAAVLAGRAHGVYSWSSTASAADVRREVGLAGRRFVHLDTAAAADKAAFLERAAAAFGFPGWFGRNWDAFADSLGDVRAESGTVVLWEGWTPFARADPQQFAVALEIVRERAETTLGGPFAVLMRAEEPDPIAASEEPRA